MRGLKHVLEAQPGQSLYVARFPRAWIETLLDAVSASPRQSHASRVRGLKRVKELVMRQRIVVARFPRAWIETRYIQNVERGNRVARFPRAWIETKRVRYITSIFMSHASRVRGLKHALQWEIYRCLEVARFPRAWIETTFTAQIEDVGDCRTLPACVD